MGLFSIVVIFSVISTGLIIKFSMTDMVNENIRKELISSTVAIQTMVESALDISVRNHLKAIAQNNVLILDKFHRDVAAGKMKLSEAKHRAEQILLSQTIGKTGYIYAITSDSILAVHPNASMKNKNMSGHWLASAQVTAKNGYIEYDWKNPGEKKERAKALYMSYFEPWDWIVSVSSYREEFVSLLDIDDLHSVIESFQFGETGYAFILDGNGNIVIYPRTSDTVDISRNSGHWKKIFKKIVAQKSGRLEWKWVDTGDNKMSEKLIFFHNIPEMDWFVVSLAYTDEIRKPIYTLQKIILISTVSILFPVLPIIFYLGVVITRPLKELSRKMDKANSGNFAIHADESAYGEIGQMAGYFNSYLRSLKTFQAELQNEIKDRIQAEAQLKIFARVFDNALEGISVTDAQGTILSVNKAFSDITGYTEKEAVGQNPRILKSDRHDSEFYKNMWESITTKGTWVSEIWNRRKNGEAYPEILSISKIQNQKGETTNYVAVFHDISEMKSKEKKIRYQAYHDALTGLPNRLLALDRLKVAITHAKRQAGRIALFFIDIDDFKRINDSLGHSTGDIMLQNAGRRLKKTLRAQDTVARIGGDEFLIIIDAIESERGVIKLAQRVLEEFYKPIIINQNELFVTLSIGIAFYPEDGINAETLIKNADAAMYQSKSLGKNQYHLFTSELNERALYRMQLEKEFRNALKKREFTVFFQPKVRVEDNFVTGVEALVRWQKDDGKIIGPADFIPLAEETGLIIPLGEFVFEESCKALKALESTGHTGICAAVNISPVQFKQEGIADNIMKILRKYHLSSSLLELEITENTMMIEFKESIKKLDLLKKNGISIAIDDFGTGYSSLYYLKTLPISTLKIDKSFIDDITDNQIDAQIVETIIIMSKNLGLKVVAEGVETKEQLAQLKRFGCDLIQGYYFARPMPLNELVKFLNKTS